METQKNLSPSMEDYLESIYNLELQHGAARLKQIAHDLDVHKTSVTSAIRSLKENGLVKHEPYEYIHLTDDGERLARTITTKHAILKNFLIRVLNVNPAIAEEDACKMEHHIQQETLQQLVLFIEFIESNPNFASEYIEEFRKECLPCGKKKSRKMDPIFGEAMMDQEETVIKSLDTYLPGESGIIARLNLNEDIRQRIMDLGLIPGCKIDVIREAPLGDPLEVVVRGYHLSIRKADAHGILVKQLL